MKLYRRDRFYSLERLQAASQNAHAIISRGFQILQLFAVTFQLQRFAISNQLLAFSKGETNANNGARNETSPNLISSDVLYYP
jgi:hypothetical protein